MVQFAVATLQLAVADAEFPTAAFRAASVLQRSTSARLRELSSAAIKLLALRTRVLTQKAEPPAAVDELLQDSFLSPDQSRELRAKFDELRQDQTERNRFVSNLINSRVRLFRAEREGLLTELRKAVSQAEQQNISKTQLAVLQCHMALLEFDGGEFSRQIRLALQTITQSNDPEDVKVAYQGIITAAKETLKTLISLINDAKSTGDRASDANQTVLDKMSETLAKSSGTTDQRLIDLIDKSSREIDDSLAAIDILNAELAALFELMRSRDTIRVDCQLWMRVGRFRCSN
jgi:hypothetical protein